MKRSLILALACILVTCSILGYWGRYNFSAGLHPVTPADSSKEEVILVPLDTRPPCGFLVEKAAAIAKLKITMPPHELLDYYTLPGETENIRQWLLANIKDGQPVIISIDQLLFGGLIASREKELSPADIDSLKLFLETLHQKYPHSPLYAFSILPRISPPPSIENYQERKDIIRYSRLVDRTVLYQNKEDFAELHALKAKLPAEDLAKYHQLYSQNTALNKELIELVKNKTLTRLVIGQDDGEEYGMPNIEKRNLMTLIAEDHLTSDEVCLTHGADEVALTLLTEIKMAKQNYQPKIYLAYNDPSVPEMIMPYMASSVRLTAEEKISMLHGKIVNTPEEADFILLISCGSGDTLSSRQQTVTRLNTWLNKGYQVALVDLSEHFLAEETLFPLLLKQDVPLESLIAYAGWNTTSNSIGTALAEAILYTGGLKSANNDEDVKQLVLANITFLNNRYLEDYFYLKDVITLVNNELKKAGYHNVYDLDLEHNFRWANHMLRQGMKDRVNSFKYSAAVQRPFKVKTKNGTITFQLKELTFDTSYPWPRTFEIYFDSQPYLYTTENEK